MIIAENGSAHESPPQHSAARQFAPGCLFILLPVLRDRHFSAPMQPELNAVSTSRKWLPLFALYALFTLVLVLPSITLWSHTPFDVLKYNFDWFCGWFQFPGWTPAEMKLLGRGVQTVLFLALGIVFYRLATRYADAIEHTAPRTFWIAVGGLLAIHLAALPWLNPDMFYGIGRGWVDAHYGLEPYRFPVLAIPDWKADPMFANMEAPLLKVVGNYGPLHHSLCALLTSLSGGDIKVATFLFKLTQLGFLLGSAALLFALARREGLRARHVVFCFLCNPIVPLVFVAFGHNDIQQNFFLLLAIWCVYAGRPLISGGALGAALALKYVAIVFAPALVLFWWARDGRRLRAPLLCLLGFLAVLIYAHALYPSSWMTTLSIYAVGWSPIRSSSYCVLYYFAPMFGLTSTAAIRWTLVAVWVLAGAAISFAYALKKKPEPADLLKVCIWLFNLYFLLAAPAVLEWYLTWTLACVLLLPSYFRYFSVLFSFYLPLVPWTLQLPNEILFPVSIVHYLFLVACVVFLAPWRQRPAAKESAVASGPATLVPATVADE